MENKVIQHLSKINYDLRLVHNCVSGHFQALLWAKPDMVGMLLKRGGNVKSWKRRQFILKDAYLFYFKVQTSVVKFSNY